MNETKVKTINFEQPLKSVRNLMITQTPDLWATVNIMFNEDPLKLLGVVDVGLPAKYKRQSVNNVLEGLSIVGVHGYLKAENGNLRSINFVVAKK